MILLTILTGVAGAALLIVLAIALAKILHVLESIGRSLDKIAMGVRAIDTQATPLPKYIESANGSLSSLHDGLEVAKTHLTGADQKLDTLTKILVGK